MRKVLKYVGKGAWKEIDESEVKPSDKIQAATRKKHTPESKLEDFFDTLSKDIFKNGYRSIKISSLLDAFSVINRSSKSLITITEKFRKKGIYSLPEYSNDLKLDSTIRLYNYPVKQLGDIFKKENDLEDYFYENELYKWFGIKTVIRQHSPRGSKDRLDFKGDMDGGEIVVLELKNVGGGKSAVEQVLRYSGLLKMEYPAKTIRLVLVTGVQNYETALAIRGMHPEQRNHFEWYLYKYHKEEDSFAFIRVTDEDINFQTTKMV